MSCGALFAPTCSAGGGRLLVRLIKREAKKNEIEREASWKREMHFSLFFFFFFCKLTFSKKKEKLINRRTFACAAKEPQDN